MRSEHSDFLRIVKGHSFGFYSLLFAVFLLGALQIVIYLGEKWYMPQIAIALSIIALIWLVVALISITKVIKDGRQRDRDTKRDEVRKALREAAKSLSPTGTEYTEEQLDTWMKGI